MKKTIAIFLCLLFLLLCGCNTKPYIDTYDPLPTVAPPVESQVPTIATEPAVTEFSPSETTRGQKDLIL